MTAARSIVAACIAIVILPVLVVVLIGASAVGAYEDAQW